MQDLRDDAVGVEHAFRAFDEAGSGEDDVAVSSNLARLLWACPVDGYQAVGREHNLTPCADDGKRGRVESCGCRARQKEGDGPPSHTSTDIRRGRPHGEVLSLSETGFAVGSNWGRMTTAISPSRMADFDLTPEQRTVRRAVREFAEREILPLVEEHEAEERYPAALIRKLIPLGYLTPLIPEQYGGGNVDVVTYGVICEELARVDWVVASVVSVTNSLVAGSIVRFGTDAQKDRWLPAICDGSVLTSACLTEPSGGSDLAGVRTRAVKTDGGWRLEGSKVFISHAAHAGVMLVAATVDPEQRHRGVTTFLVDPRADGVEITEIPMRTLKRDNLSAIHFDGIEVGDDALLGDVGGGFPILGAALDMGRFSVAARCVGQAQRAIDLSVPYATEREAFGQRIGEFQMIQQKIADMICRTESARALVYGLGRMKDAGIERCSVEASTAKLMASEAATANALDAIQIHGGYGFSSEYEVGRLLLEAKSLEVGEGTSELHRKLIAEHALGMR